MSTGIKIAIAVIMAGTVGIGAGLGFGLVYNKQEITYVEEVMDQVEEEEVVIEEQGRSTEDIIAEFRGIVDVYNTAIVKEDLYGEQFVKLVTDELKQYGVELYGEGIANRYDTTDKMYYGLFDLNGDGELAMIISLRHPKEIKESYVLYYDALYATYEDEIRFLCDREWSMLKIYKNNKIGMNTFNGEITYCSLYRYEAGELVLERDVIEVEEEMTGPLSDSEKAAYNADGIYEFAQDGDMEKENDGSMDLNQVEWFEFKGLDNEDTKIEL